MRVPKKTVDPDCFVRLHGDGTGSWKEWFPGWIIGSEVVKYPHSVFPEAPIYLVEFNMYEEDQYAPLERGWFNPLLGSIWWPRQPEPTLSYHESMAVHKEQTSILIPVKSSVVVAGQLGVFDVYYQASMKPDCMGEDVLEKGIEILEGLYRGNVRSSGNLDRAAPNTQASIEKLLKLGRILWDGRRKCARYDVGVSHHR